MTPFCRQGNFEGAGRLHYLLIQLKVCEQQSGCSGQQQVNRTDRIPALMGLTFSWGKIIVLESTVNIYRAHNHVPGSMAATALCVILTTGSVGYYLRKLNSVDFRRIFSDSEGMKEHSKGGIIGL